MADDAATPRRKLTGSAYRRAVTIAALLALAVAANPGLPTAQADNRRLDDSVVADVYTIQHQAGCSTDIHINRSFGWLPDRMPTTC